MITGEQLLEVFTAYNLQIWPMQYVAYLLGVTVVYFAIRKTAFSARGIPAILAFFWLWVALLFWLPSVLKGFAPGVFFVAIFLIQGVLLVLQAIKPRLYFEASPGIITWVGWGVVLYASAGYPLVGALVGHIYPRMLPFGLTPCPMVTLTFGLLLWTRPKVPKALLVIPGLYALSGVIWISIGMWEDIGMMLSGILGMVLLWLRDAKSPAAQVERIKPGPMGGGWSLDLPDKKSAP